MEAIFLVCGAGGPQLKRNPLGRNERQVSLSFHADAVAMEHRDGNLIVGFAHKRFGTTQYLLFQRSDTSDPQDVALGMDTYYVERDDQRHSCYGGLTRLELRPDRILASFAPEAAARLGANAVQVSFSIDNHTFAKLEAQLNQVFRDRAEVTVFRS